MKRRKKFKKKGEEIRTFREKCWVTLHDVSNTNCTASCSQRTEKKKHILHCRITLRTPNLTENLRTSRCIRCTLISSLVLIYGRLHKTHHLTINIYFHLTTSTLQYYGPNSNNTAINVKPNGRIYSVYIQTPFSNKLCKSLADVSLSQM